MGSSPRIRGEFDGEEHLVKLAGIIPANTGRMSHGPARRSGHRDHPREYGENIITAKGYEDNGGSSPRIRGEYAAHTTTNGGFGIIPANTGRISPFSLFAGTAWDHPREYGENTTDTFFRCSTQGSSPRIRGEFQVHRNLFGIDGIIPANTGRIPAPLRSDLK